MLLPNSPVQDSMQFPSVPNTPANWPGNGTTGTRWQARRSSNSARHPGRRRSRTKSISEHTQDAVKVVAPPISISLVFMCLAWYLSSAFSSNVSKAILQIFRYPVSLTMIQFMYAAFFSALALWLAQRYPSIVQLFPRNTISTSGLADLRVPGVLQNTAPMAGFQIVGHIFSHSATSQIPVSLVHAIKSLSPLLTVVVYTFAFGARYNASTYLSLLPLTAGVMMACAAEFRARPIPIFYAFMSCIVFVSQNIWSKGLLTSGTMSSAQSSSNNAVKLDKITIIFYCAIVGFAGTLPIWLLSDGIKILKHGLSLHNGSFFQFMMLTTLNGLTHFCQNLLSFMILGSISTVAYSIASLLKRIFVMSAAIIWFRQPVTGPQGWGIFITFAGLYIYDRFGSKTNTDKKMLPR